MIFTVLSFLFIYSYYKEQLFFHSFMNKNIHQWITHGKQYNRMLFFYEEKVLDLTEFSIQHPGGKKALANYIFKDITDILFNVFPHKREQTLKRLFNYIVGTIPELEVIKRSRAEKCPHQIGAKQKKKVCFKRKSGINQETCQENNFEMAKLLDKKQKVQSKEETKSKQRKHQNKSKKKQARTFIKPQESTPKLNIKKNAEKTSLNIVESAVERNIENEFNKDIQFNQCLDEQKPDFKIPIQSFHLMNKIQT